MNHVQRSGELAAHKCPSCSGSGLSDAGQAAQELLNLPDSAQKLTTFGQMDYDGRVALASIDIDAYRSLRETDTMGQAQ